MPQPPYPACPSTVLLADIEVYVIEDIHPIVRVHMMLFHSLFTSIVLAGTPPQSFAHLKKIDIEGEATLYVEPSVNCTPTDIVEQQSNGDGGFQGPPVYDVCTVDVGNKKFKVVYSSGPSADPYFELYPISKKGKQGDRSVLAVGATTLYIPKGKNVYSEGWCNTMFNERRKYTHNGTGFIEAKQPYLYVGLKTTVQPLGSEQKPLVLYADKSKQTRVATLPVGSEIEVLLHEQKEWYLVRTSFGLVGWTNVLDGVYDTQIGVRFAGD